MSIVSDPASRTICVRGTLDLETAPAVCAAIEDLAAAEGDGITVDLRAVESADSTALRALVGATKEAAIRACRLVVAVEPESDLDHLLTRSGSREFLQVATT